MFKSSKVILNIIHIYSSAIFARMKLNNPALFVNSVKKKEERLNVLTIVGHCLGLIEIPPLTQAIPGCLKR